MYRVGDRVAKKDNARNSNEELIVASKVFTSYVFNEDGMYPDYKYILINSEGETIPGTFSEEMLQRI